MDCVLAKVKRLRRNAIFKLISGHEIFSNFDVNPDDCVSYSPDHNLDEESWFKLEQFSTQPYFLEMLRGDFDEKIYCNLTADKFTDISYICAVQAGDFYFQKVTPSLFIRRKTFVFGEVAEFEEDRVRLVVNSRPDAVYFKSMDVLIFKDLAAISSMFVGIDELYKEATQEDVEQFLSSQFINLVNGFCVDKVSKPNRRRIGLAMVTLAEMPVHDKEAMLAYIRDYCEGKLEFDGGAGKFGISSDNELKLLVYGIEQRFYTTPFGQERRLANSVLVLDNAVR